MRTWLFLVKDVVFQVTELARSGIYVVVGSNGYVGEDFESSPGEAGAKAVLFSALNHAGKKGQVTHEVANWPEKDIRLVGHVATH